jgi:hypothetical protein
MKNRQSVFRIAVAGITAAAVCLGAAGSAIAQNASTTSPNPANPSGIFPGPGSAVAGTATFTPGPGNAGNQGPTLPYGVGEVVKMYQGGINKDVIINYIDNTALAYHLSADGIIYLHNMGMPQEITKAMILRDGQLQQQGMRPPPYPQNYAQQQPMPPPGAGPNGYGYAGQPPPDVASPSTPPPDVTVVGSDYPVYDAAYPYYGYYGYPYYGYYGWPGYVGGWGWGRGWGGGFRGGFHGGVGGFHGGVGGFHGGGGFGGGHGAVGGHGGGGHGGGGHGGGGGGHR